MISTTAKQRNRTHHSSLQQQQQQLLLQVHLVRPTHVVTAVCTKKQSTATPSLTELRILRWPCVSSPVPTVTGLKARRTPFPFRRSGSAWRFSSNLFATTSGEKENGWKGGGKGEIKWLEGGRGERQWLEGRGGKGGRRPYAKHSLFWLIVLTLPHNYSSSLFKA